MITKDKRAKLNAYNELTFDNAQRSQRGTKKQRDAAHTRCGVTMKPWEWEQYRLMCIRYPNDEIFVFRLDGKIQFALGGKVIQY